MKLQLYTLSHTCPINCSNPTVMFQITEMQFSLQVTEPLAWLLPRMSLYLQLSLEANNDKFRNHNDHGEQFPPESIKTTCKYWKNRKTWGKITLEVKRVFRSCTQFCSKKKFPSHKYLQCHVFLRGPHNRMYRVFHCLTEHGSYIA